MWKRWETTLFTRFNGIKTTIDKTQQTRQHILNWNKETISLLEAVLQFLLVVLIFFAAHQVQFQQMFLTECHFHDIWTARQIFFIWSFVQNICRRTLLDCWTPMCLVYIRYWYAPTKRQISTWKSKNADRLEILWERKIDKHCKQI